MIQRIQTLYLLITAFLSLLFYKGGFMKFTDNSGSVISITFKGLLREKAMSNPELVQNLLPVTVLIVILTFTALITILFFKRRDIQLWFSGFLIVFASGFVIVCCYYAYYVITKYHAVVLPVVKMIVPLFVLIFTVLAYRGIKNDDKLVKSYDRLR